jgi:hypothetical protein
MACLKVPGSGIANLIFLPGNKKGAGAPFLFIKLSLELQFYFP